MTEENKIKSALFRTLISLLLCLFAILLKFILNEKNFLAEVYNYLASDIVFLS